MLAFQRRVGEKLQRILHIKLPAIAHRNGRLYHHHRIRIHTQHQINHIFNVVRVEKILHRVVVGGCRNHNVVGIPVSRSAIKRGSEIQLLFSKIFFDIIILNRTLAAINFIHLFRYHIHSLHLMMLRKQSGNRQTHITGACHRNLQILKFLHSNVKKMKSKTGTLTPKPSPKGD